MLTGLPNRFLFYDRLNQAIKNAKRKHTKVAVLFIDLDHFKEINDSLGHGVGDTVLKVSGNRIQKEIRCKDILARFGGDEFVVILEDIEDINDISIISRKDFKVFRKISLGGKMQYISIRKYWN